MTVHVHPVYRPVPADLKGPDTIVVSTIARNSQLSPFVIGPCKLYEDPYQGDLDSKNMENAWQYAKVYEEHWDAKEKEPNDDYWYWAILGWENPKAVRYPMGKGRKPVGSWWDGELLGYVDARKKIYGPLYEEAVRKTAAWIVLLENYRRYKNVVLLDYDAYDHHGYELSLTEVLNNPKKKMGHAFVLAMMLTKDPALKQMELRR